MAEECCPICFITVKNQDEAAYHVWKYHLNFKPRCYKEKIHHCKVCERDFEHDAMEAHLQQYHPNYAWCQLCGEVFVLFDSYIKIHLVNDCPTRINNPSKYWIDIVHHIECYRHKLLEQLQTVWTPCKNNDKTNYLPFF